MNAAAVYLLYDLKPPPLPGLDAGPEECARAFAAGRVVVSILAEANAHVAWQLQAVPELRACAPLPREAARVNADVGAAMDAVLHQLGHHVVGVDASPDMLAQAASACRAPTSTRPTFTNCRFLTTPSTPSSARSP